MTELENMLRSEETETLQRKLLTDSFIEEAATIARQVLTERGAVIPAPRSEEETERTYRESRKRSTAKFIAVIIWFFGIWLFKLYEPENHYVFMASGLSLAAFLGFYK